MWRTIQRWFRKRFVQLEYTETMKQCRVEYHVEGVEQCGEVKGIDLYNEYAMK